MNVLSERLEEDKKFTMFFVKFMPKKYIEKFRSGYIRLNNLKTYVEMEKASKEKGIGDKYEGALVMKNLQLRMYDTETDELKFEFDVGEANLQNEFELLFPVFCTYIIDSDNLVITSENELNATTKIKISDEELEQLVKEFGSSAVLIKANEFIERFVKASIEQEYILDAEKVKYYDYSINQKERFENFFNDLTVKKVFVKDNYFEHQNEYRIVITNKTITEPLDFFIGDISDISYEMDAIQIFKKTEIKFDKTPLM